MTDLRNDKAPPLPQTTRWYKDHIPKNANKVATNTIKAGYNLNETQLKELVTDLSDYLNDEGVLNDIQAASGYSKSLKSLKDKYFMAWYDTVDCPQLQDARIPAEFRTKNAAFFWERMLATERKHGKRERSPESTTSSTHHKRNKWSPSVESIGLSSLQVKQRNTAVPLRSASLTVRDGRTQRELVKIPLLSITHPNFSDRKFDESLTFTPYMCAFDVLYARLTTKLPHDFKPGQTVLRAGGSPLPITDDDDLVGAIVTALDLNMQEGVSIDLINTQTEKDPDLGMYL